MLLDSLKKLFRRNRLSFILIIIGVVVYAAITIFGIYDNNDALIKKDLEKEFAQIQHLPDAEPVQPDPTFFSHGYLALVSNRYKTTLSYPEIRSYYDSELTKHGWKYGSENDVLIWGQNYGGKAVLYYKGQYTAALEYAGDREAEVGWTYSFDVGLGF